MLKIALLGAPHTGKSALASGLHSAAKASAWPAIIQIKTDHSLLSAVLPGYDLVLLTGLESAAHAQTDTRPAAASQQMREAADASIRAALADAGIAYRVLYGRSDERLTQACAAIQSLLAPTEAPARLGFIRAPQKPAPWVWLCDKCSDPQCEHKLLSALLAQRAQAA